MKSITVFDTNGKEKDKVKIDTDVILDKVNNAAVYQSVVMYMANSRQGTASTKTRSEVSGGGKKPWRQKGTGRARVGSIRSPLWRHGGVTFGPKPRDFSYTLPKKITKLALQSALSDRINNECVTVIDVLSLEQPKTKVMANILKALKITGKCLICIETSNENILLACRNIAGVSCRTASDVNALDILQHAKVLMTKKSFELLQKRLKKQ